MSVGYQTLPGRETRPRTDAFLMDVREGLSRVPKTIPSMYFYDDRGSRLFQQITELDEYYLTRSEMEILPACAHALASRLRGQPFRLIELGAGEGAKTETLLEHLDQHRLDFDYVPIDICEEAVARLTRMLRSKRPPLACPIHGLVAEYFEAVSLLSEQSDRRNVILFLGSSIGNFDPPATRKLLRRLRRSLNAGDYVLVGFDLKKDISILSAAYDDPQGVTREFNFNLLDRINRELGGQFQRSGFLHYAPYNVRLGCMESWLVSREDQEVAVEALNRAFSFRAWEGIRMERSYKYHVADVEELAASSGFLLCQHLFDRRRWFLDSLWQVP